VKHREAIEVHEREQRRLPPARPSPPPSPTRKSGGSSGTAQDVLALSGPITLQVCSRPAGETDHTDWEISL
jgi:hypothetical protein